MRGKNPLWLCILWILAEINESTLNKWLRKNGTWSNLSHRMMLQSCGRNVKSWSLSLGWAWVQWAQAEHHGCSSRCVSKAEQHWAVPASFWAVAISLWVLPLKKAPSVVLRAQAVVYLLKAVPCSLQHSSIHRGERSLFS